jgi:hypothetical protein
MLDPGDETELAAGKKDSLAQIGRNVGLTIDYARYGARRDTRMARNIDNGN